MPSLQGSRRVDAKKENTVEIDLKELDIKNMTASILSASKLQDHNTFADPYKIQPADFKNFDVIRLVMMILNKHIKKSTCSVGGVGVPAANDSSRLEKNFIFSIFKMFSFSVFHHLII